MRLKTLTIAGMLSFLAATYAAAATDSVNVVTKWKSGKSTEESIKLEKIDANTARLRIPYKKLSRHSWMQIEHIDIVNPDAIATKGEKGYWVLSDGRMGEFTHDNGSIIELRNPMQMFGFKKGDEAFVAIIKGLKYEFSMILEVKNGEYKLFPRFGIGQIGMPIYEDLVIDFVYFKGADANYSSMGRAYRDYQLGRGEVVPLKERIKGNPQLRYSVDSIVTKFTMAASMYESVLGKFRGYHWKDVETPNPRIIRNFDSVMDAMKKLKALGVEKTDVIVTNWNLRIEGFSPIYGTAAAELGGNAKCREFNALGKKLGYQTIPHIMHTENYTVSPAFNKSELALQKDGSYIHYEGLGGEAYRPCWHQVYYKQVLKEYTDMQQLGFTSGVHIDVTTAISPYRCFDISHFCTLNDTAFYMNQVGLLSDAFFGTFGSEGPCDQVANTFDYALYVSAYPKYLGRESPLITRLIPIWQIAYHGIILSNPFASTIDYNCRTRTQKSSWSTSFTPETRRLKLYEFGGRPTYYWHLDNEKNFPDVKTGYDEYQKSKYLQLEFMDFHDEIAPDVFLTRYSDGSEIVTNYTKKDFKYKKGVVRPMDYALFKPVK